MSKWIEWNATEDSQCPVPADAMVEYRMRFELDDEKPDTAPAGDLDWSETEDETIVSFRVVSQLQVKWAGEWCDAEYMGHYGGMPVYAFMRSADGYPERYPVASVMLPSDVRVKPETVMINGIECPAPMRGVPEYKERYFVPTLDDADNGYFCSLWDNEGIDRDRLAAGLCFRAAEDAAAVAKAMRAPLKGGDV